MAKTVAERQKTYRARVKEQDPERYASMLERNRKYQESYTRTPTSKSASYKKYKESEKGRATYIRNHLRRKYDLSVEAYQNMLEAQGGVCKICRCADVREWNDGRKQLLPLCVDHCHDTGNVRGLLCNKCNVAIALMQESVSNLENAIVYLTGAENF